MIRKLMVICCLLCLFLFVSNLNVAIADTASFRVYDNDTSYHRRIIEPDNGDNSSHAGIYQENEIATLYKWNTATLSGQCVSSSSATFAVSLFQGVNFGDTNYRWSVRRLLRDFTTVATWNTYDGTHNWTTPGGRGEGDVSSTYANNDMIYNFNNGYITFNLDPSEITKMIAEDKGLIFSLPAYTSGTHYITFGIPVLNITYAACSSPTPSPTPAPTETPTPTPTPKLPVILIPGIFGSEFEVKETIANSGIKQCNIGVDYEYIRSDTVWLDLEKRFPDYMLCGNYLDVLQLKDDGVEKYKQIGLKDTIVNTDYLGQHFGYYDALHFFADKNYTPKKDFFIFPYDWRKDLSENVKRLDDKISIATAAAGTTKVQIVAHSMGGLVARDYIRDPDNAQKVDTLIELGTPNIGAPAALAHA